MTQKLLVMERDTKEELKKAIDKELKDANFTIRGLSVLEQIDWGKFPIDSKGIVPRHYLEAWIIIDDKSDYVAGFE